MGERHTLSRRRVLLGGAAAWCVRPAFAQMPAATAEVPETYGTAPGTVVRFASVQQGRAVLTADDDWMRATSEFQRRAIMGSATPVAMEDFRRWNNDAVRPWTAEQRQRQLKALAVVMPAFAALRIPLPPEVLLVCSNGQESAGAPYTRGNAVVLPTGGEAPPYSDASLMAHELWHVASRHAPALASKLYAEIGFEPMPELAFPPAWGGIRLANPDAPANRHAMRLTLEGRDVRVTPVLVVNRTQLAAGETFFHVLEVRLLEVQSEPGGARSRAVLGPDDAPRWFPVGNAYLQRLGGNTGYVIHPEETIADNVALLALMEAAQPGSERPPVRNAELLARLRAVLLAPR